MELPGHSGACLLQAISQLASGERKNRREARREKAKERLLTNLTKGHAGIPGSGKPSDWSSLTRFVNHTRASTVLVQLARGGFPQLVRYVLVGNETRSNQCWSVYNLVYGRRPYREVRLPSYLSHCLGAHLWMKCCVKTYLITSKYLLFTDEQWILGHGGKTQQFFDMTNISSTQWSGM